MLGSLGIPEVLFIFVIALLVFGPRRLPEIGRTLGKALGEFRRATTDLKRTFDAEAASIEEVTHPVPAPEPVPEPDPEQAPEQVADPIVDPDLAEVAESPPELPSDPISDPAVETASADRAVSDPSDRPAKLDPS